MRILIPFFFILIVCIVLSGCDSLMKTNGDVIKKVEIEDIDGISDFEGVEIDREVYADGKESLKINSEDKSVLRIANTGDIDIDNSVLLYRAKIKTENLDGKVYLEMWCSFPEKGQYFSKALDTALSGTNDWTVQETPFFLKEGENPEDVKLNIVVEGTGIVWIDQIELLKKPLK